MRTGTPIAHAPSRASGAAPAQGHSAFTVLELVIVVGVLSVLLAIVLPTIKTVRAATLKNRACVEATQLAQAAIRYKTEYGFWPGQLQTKEKADNTVELRPAFKNQQDISVIVSGPKAFTDALRITAGANPIYLNENEVYQSFRRVGEKSGGTYKSNPLNPKGIRFLDLLNEHDVETVDFLDPWGRNYVLFMGLNPDLTFQHTVTVSGGGTHVIRVKNTIAFAFSYGADGDQSTNYLYSAGVKQ